MTRVDYFCYRWILLSLDTYIYIKEQHSISLQTKQKSIQQEEKKKQIATRIQLQDPQVIPTKNLKRLSEIQPRSISGASPLKYLLPNNTYVITLLKLCSNCSSASPNRKQPIVQNLHREQLQLKYKIAIFEKTYPISRGKKKKSKNVLFSSFFRKQFLPLEK